MRHVISGIGTLFQGRWDIVVVQLTELANMHLL